MDRITPARRRAILEEVQRLLRSLYEMRRELGVPSLGDPLELIALPFIAQQILGLRYYEPEEIPSAVGWNQIAGIMDRDRREIAVAQSLKLEVRRFTAAHEIGHWVLHPGVKIFRDAPLDGSNQDQWRPIEEREADLFATALLMPADLVCERFQLYFVESSGEETRVLPEVERRMHQNDKLLRHLMGQADEDLRPSACRQPGEAPRTSADVFEELAALFRVSPEAMAIRLEDLNLVFHRPALDQQGESECEGPEYTNSLVNQMSLAKSLRPRVYEEFIDFIARGGNPAEVIAFRPSEEAHARLEDLLDREKGSGLTAEEKSELDHYLQLEHIMRLAKARARQYLSRT